MSGPGPAPFSLSIDDRDERLLIAVRGELDLATADQLEDAMLPPLRDGRHVVLDLRELEFMDSTGVRVVVAGHNAAGDHGGRLTLLRTGEGSPVRRVLEISGLDGVLEIVDDAPGAG